MHVPALSLNGFSSVGAVAIFASRAHGNIAKINRRLELSPIFPSVHQSFIKGTDHFETSTIADVNGDGHLDIVKTIGRKDNELYLNDGDGNFPSTPVILPGGEQGTFGAGVGDFNNDGYTDIFVSNQGWMTETGKEAQLLLNDGNGGFPSALTINIPSPNYSHGVVAVDINNDGNLDAIISSYGPYGSIMLLGDGTGNFSSHRLPDNGQYQDTVGFVAGDLNNDGHIDLVGQIYVRDPEGEQVTIFFNDGQIIPSFTLQYFDTSNPRRVALGDINNDGHIDIVTADHKGANLLYINDGNAASFTTVVLPGDSATSTATFGVDIADVNGDMYDDIVFGNRKGVNNQLLLNNKNGGFDVYDLQGDPGDTSFMVFGDVNGDLRPDLLVLNYVYGEYQYGDALFINDSNHTVELSTPATPEPTSSPTPYPWFIDFQNVDANFTLASDDELRLTYRISKQRKENVPALLKKDCATNILEAGLINTTYDRTDNGTHDILVIKHNINKTMVGNSSIYNATSKKLEVCQKVQLVVESPLLTIVEDIHAIGVNFELDIDYTIANIILAAATIYQNETKINLDSYITSCKCNPQSTPNNYACDNTALKPNDEVHLCAWSSSADIGIDYIMSMLFKQKNSTKSLAIIENEAIMFPSFTSWMYVPTMHGPGSGVVVSSRLPINVFDFGAAEVEVTGTIVMELDGSSPGRKLEAADTSLAAAGDNAASFDIVLTLQEDLEFSEDPIVSAGMFASYGFVSLELMFLLACIMW